MIKLTSIPQLARNVVRLREIIGVLSKYGLADWISRLDLDFAKGLFRNRDGQVLASLTSETRVRLALIELGPTFIKLGQMLSTRADLIGPALARELTALQDGTPADAPDVVRALIVKELGKPVEELFAEFDDVPLASASIGQVHRARLKTGEAVVVKVQHAGIESVVHNDLEILIGASQLAEEHLPELANYRPRATTTEFQRTLRRELDFRREQRNLSQFLQNFKRDATVHVPLPYPEFSTSRVLTMELLEGVRLTDFCQLTPELGDHSALAKQGATIFLKMIFDHGFYHADPHPGNLLVMPGSVIGLLDCGMVGRVDDRTREYIEEMLVAVANHDAAALSNVIMRIGSAPAAFDQAGLEFDIEEFVSFYADQPLSQFDLGGALSEMTEIIQRWHIVLPAGVALLLKVLIMLEGTARLLHPNFNLTEMIAGYQRKLLLRRFSPRRRLKRWARMFTEWELLGESLPRSISDILNQVQTGRFEVHLQHRSLEPSVNRLVFGMLASSLFVGSSMMLSAQVQPTVGGLSLIGAFGVITSLGLGLRLIRAINKSGHLDERK